MTQPVNDALHFCVLDPKSFWQAISFWHSDVPCLSLVFFWWLRHGQIFPMRHRSDGRGYIWIVNSLLLLSVHATCHRRCQAEVAVTAVVWGFPPHHWNGKRHCHSLMIYPASKTYCTRFAHNVWCQVLVLVTRFTPKVHMVGFLDQRHYRTPLTLTSLPHTHNRIGLHCSHKSDTSCPTPALLQTETEALSGSDAMTLSCDLTLVTALVTHDWWPYHEH